jgi:hypothetical protein
MDREEIKILVADCWRRQHKMNAWEKEFIESITGRATLTEQQWEKLNEIWEKVT